MGQPASEQARRTDAHLIRATRAGEAAAYATLYARHAGAARGLAGQLVWAPADVDDVVAEAFARVLDLLHRGGGPADAFRPYLLTAVRRAAYDRYRAGRRPVLTGETEAFGPGQPFIDPAVAALERTVIARAFLSLPERWRAVLWHTEIEGAKPAEVATLLGLSANGVAALAYRAREGLRQAYLQMHLSAVARQECRPVAGDLGAYVRGGLSSRDTAAVTAHLEGCADCRAVYAELADVNVALRGIVAPIFLGPAAAAYLSTLAAGGGPGGAPGWLGGGVAWLRHAPKQQQGAVAAGAAAAVAALTAIALALTAGTAAVRRPPRPAAAAPVPSSAPAVLPASPPAGHEPAPVASAPARHLPAPPPAAVPLPAASHPGSAPRPPAPARLIAEINPVGSLVQGGTGIITFAVTNPGQDVVRDVTAAVTLPPGVTYLAGGTPGMDTTASSGEPGGWSCRAAPGAAQPGVQCSHRPLGPDASATSYLQVAIAPDAPPGTPPTVEVAQAGARVTARGAAGVVAAGWPARYAAAGHEAVVSTGNAFPRLSWWDYLIPGWGQPSSSARLAVPGQVQWAGLYWSWAGDGTRAGLELAGPGGGFSDISAADTGTDKSQRQPVHQAFANVTGMVRQGGPGVWSAAIPGDGSGDEHYSGWALVVAVADPAARAGQVMVLDGTHMVAADRGTYAIALQGLLRSGRQAGVQETTWAAHEGGPEFTHYLEPVPGSPYVTFAAGPAPYLAGVIAVTDPPAGLMTAGPVPAPRPGATATPGGSAPWPAPTGVRSRVKARRSPDKAAPGVLGTGPGTWPPGGDSAGPAPGSVPWPGRDPAGSAPGSVPWPGRDPAGSAPGSIPWPGRDPAGPASGSLPWPFQPSAPLRVSTGPAWTPGPARVPGPSVHWFP